MSKRKAVDDTCAICLEGMEGESSDALLDPCLHRFHFACVKSWSEVAPTCPLCKASFRVILHDIRSDSDFSRHVVAPRRSPVADAHFAERMAHFPLAGVASPSSESSTPASGRSSAVVAAMRARAAAATALATAPSRDERPFFSGVVGRVLRRLPGVPTPSWNDSSVAPLPGVTRLFAQQIEYLDDLHWRRLVYLQNAATEPTADDAPWPAPARLRLLRPWLDREVRAITGDANPAVVVSFITDVLSAAHRPAAAGAGVGAGVVRAPASAAAPVTAPHIFAQLRPFLGSHVHTFLRELRAVAASTLPLSTYDQQAKGSHVEQFLLADAIQRVAGASPTVVPAERGGRGWQLDAPRPPPDSRPRRR